MQLTEEMREIMEEEDARKAEYQALAAKIMTFARDQIMVSMRLSGSGSVPYAHDPHGYGGDLRGQRAGDLFPGRACAALVPTGAQPL